MADWLLVVTGGLIAILAGPVTELSKDYFDRKRRREDRAQDFQREHLLALSQHLVDGQIALMFFLGEPWEDRFPAKGLHPNYVTYQENVLRAGWHATLLTNRHLRGLTQEWMRATAAATKIKDKDAVQVEKDKTMKMFSDTTRQIGDAIDKL